MPQKPVSVIQHTLGLGSEPLSENYVENSYTVSQQLDSQPRDFAVSVDKLMLLLSLCWLEIMAGLEVARTGLEITKRKLHLEI